MDSSSLMKADWIDPRDGMPSRSYLAMECLVYRMRQISATFLGENWIEDLEFGVWDMAHEPPHQFAGHEMTEEAAKSFRDLGILAGGRWVSPDAESNGHSRETFVSTEEWERRLRDRLAR